MRPENGFPPAKIFFLPRLPLRHPKMSRQAAFSRLCRLAGAAASGALPSVPEVNSFYTVPPSALPTVTTKIKNGKTAREANPSKKGGTPLKRERSASERRAAPPLFLRRKARKTQKHRSRPYCRDGREEHPDFPIRISHRR